MTAPRASSFIVMAALLSWSCGEDRTLSRAEKCAATSVDACLDEGCGLASVRRVTAEAPANDDDCFGEPIRICVAEPDTLLNNAMCVYVYRGDEVLRLDSAVLPEDWRTCAGEDDEPAGCRCADLGGCGR